MLVHKAFVYFVFFLTQFVFFLTITLENDCICVILNLLKENEI